MKNSGIEDGEGSGSGFGAAISCGKHGFLGETTPGLGMSQSGLTENELQDAHNPNKVPYIPIEVGIDDSHS